MLKAGDDVNSGKLLDRSRNRAADGWSCADCTGQNELTLGPTCPGDIVYRGKNTTFYFPLATSVLVSVVLSLVLYVVGRWRR